jgi:hypothetical protein
MMKLAAFIFAALLAGCATPSAQSIGEAVPTDYEAQVRAKIVDTFFDPGSIRDAEISEPFPVNSVFDGTTPIPRSGWAVCVKANAKNRMGGYTGRHPVLFLFEGGQITFTLDQGGGMTQVSHHCDRGQYRRIDLAAIP